MEYQNLIKASSMLRAVLWNIVGEDTSDNEMSRSIQRLKADLEGLGDLTEEG